MSAGTLGKSDAGRGNVCRTELDGIELCKHVVFCLLCVLAQSICSLKVESCLAPNDLFSPLLPLI